MSRPARMVRNIAIGVGALTILIALAVLILVNTSGFQNWTKEKVEAAIAEGTGGRTEIGSFALDLAHLRVRVGALVIHGSEPADAAPFVRVAQVDLDARLFGGGRVIGISYLAIQRPQVNVIVFPDGRTNLPTPKPSAPSKNTPLETVVDLAVGHFELSQGQLTMNNRRQPLEIAAHNLRAQLWYRLLQGDYSGQLSLEPIYVAAGHNTPVTYRVTLPVVLDRDRIQVQNASIATADSNLQIDGALENLRQPSFSGRVRGHVALADLDRAMSLNLDSAGRGLPRQLQLDVNATASSNQVRVASLSLALGQTHLDANGVLKGGGGSTLQFDGSLALAELARVARVDARPEGALELRGNASLDAANRYRIAGQIFSRNLAFRQGTLRIPSAAISTDVLADPDSIELSSLRLAAFGGEFRGDAKLQNFARYQVAGSLKNFDIQGLAPLLGRRLPYSGTISGPVRASGDLNVPNGHSLAAQANLTIAPGRRGIPLSGRIEGEYRGASGDIQIGDSHLALPHTRLTLAGSTGRSIDVSLDTTDFQDLLAAAPSAGAPPLVLAGGGRAGFTGAVSGPLSAPRVGGHLYATQFQVEGRGFTSFAADVSASPSGASVANGSLARGGMTAQFSGAVGMRDWKLEPAGRIAADLNLQNGDVADLLALAGQPAQGYSGALTASAHVTGTVGNPEGALAIGASNGALHDEPFDRLDARIALSDQLATIQQASLTAGNARIDLSGRFRHPRDSFAQGVVQASIKTSRVDLARLHSLGGVAGQLQLNAQVVGDLGGTPANGFLVTNLQADAAVRGLQYQGQAYGDLQTAIRTSGRTATTDLTSDFAGSNIRLHATTQLAAGYSTAADAQIAGLPVERALAIAGHGDVPVRGKLSATAHVTGIPAQPEGNLSLDLTGASAYGEAVDRLQVRVASTPQAIELTQFQVASGPSHLALTAHYDHPAGQLDTGTLQFRLENGHIDLAHLKTVENARPGLAGSIELSADGAGAVTPGTHPFRLTSVNANLSAAHMALQGKNVGGLTLAAHTSAGNRVEFNLNSDIADASIQAGGSGELGGDYPVNAQVSFSKVKWTNLQKLLGTASGEPPAFEITAEGKASVNGPILTADALQGSLDLTTLELQTLPQPHAGRPIVIQNQGPIEARLDNGAVTLASFHLTGPQTDIQASGTAAINDGGRLNLAANAGVDLAVLQSLSHDISSSGKITLTAAVRGTMSDPQANGSLQLQNANFNYAAVPNGLSNANGAIVFQGNRASIQNLTAESGGGKVTIKGFASLAGNVRFALQASAAKVRVLVQEGVSIVGDADIRVAGVLNNSTATGSVTLTQLNYAPQSDLGSILTRAAPDVESAIVPNPLLDNMKLDVRVRTSPAMQVRASLAQNLQTDADLRLTGSASRPSLLGRIDLDEGQLVFFGSTYTVNSGRISFISPTRIQPLLNLSLETQTKGVDVVLNVTGPLDNMKLTYTSDPPLQFQEIVALLSTGHAPTSDPTLLANQPPQPSQSFEQTGESAILGQAVANPVASRLQRVFGLSQLSIDPAFTGSSALPTAQVTLQQHISTNITFTYSEALDDPNATLIRAEWALNPRWSATALRDQNGIVSVVLLYKRRFH